MKIFDCHTHRGSGDEMAQLGVELQNVIFNYVDEYQRYALDSAIKCRSLIFDFKANLEFVEGELASDRISALKIHNRIQKNTKEDFTELLKQLKRVAPKVPIIYDAFYYGPNIECQPRLEDIVSLAGTFKNKPIIVAHSGGHRVLEYLYHLRPLPNVYFDLSFSLLYLKKTSCWKDMKLLLEVTSRERLLYGSDSPNAIASVQLSNLLSLMEELGFSEKDKADVLNNNSERVFKCQN